MQPEELKNAFLDILARQIKDLTKREVDLRTLPADTKLESLELDSLTYIEAINDLEDELGVELPFSANDGRSLETLGDLLNLIDEFGSSAT